MVPRFGLGHGQGRRLGCPVRADGGRGHALKPLYVPGGVGTYKLSIRGWRVGRFECVAYCHEVRHNWVSNCCYLLISAQNLSFPWIFLPQFLPHFNQKFPWLSESHFRMGRPGMRLCGTVFTWHEKTRGWFWSSSLYFLLGMQLGSDLKAKQAAAGSSRWLAELGLGRPPSCLCCKVRDDLPGAHT